MKNKNEKDELAKFDDYLKSIADIDQRARMKEILSQIHEAFPELEVAVKWNQPMFLDHGTFIIAFSHAKKHISVAPEHVALEKFKDDFKKAGYTQTKMLVQIPHHKEVDYALIERVISFNIEYKKDWDKFWLLPTR